MDIRRTLALRSGRQLLLVVGDLLEQPVEAIVNAANSRLAHGGGVAGVISKAAGPALDEESQRWVQEHGEVPTGTAVVTTAGRLPFQGVIHAVGPSLGSGHEEVKLTAAVAAALECARQRGWQSVALPGISSGIFRVPLPICARSYVQGVLKHLMEHPESAVKEIRITLLEGPLFVLVEKEMGKV